MVIDAVLLQILAISLSILFLTAGVQKFVQQSQFASVLTAYALAPAWLLPLLVLFIPVLELVVGTGLLLNIVNTTGHWVAVAAAAALLAAYALAMGVNLWRGRHEIDCGCQFGGAPQQISYELVVRNLLLVLATGCLLFPSAERALSWFDFGVIGFGIVMACLIYGIGNNLIATFNRQLAK